MIWLKINFKMEQEDDHNTGTMAGLHVYNIIILCTSCTSAVSVICVELCNLHKIMVIMMC